MDRLSNLGDLEVADNSPDVRGWEVATMNEQSVGRVEDLIVDTRQMQARYLLVDLSAGERGRTPGGSEERVLVPVDRASIDEPDRRVRLDVATATTLPRFSGAISDDYDDTYGEPRRLPRPHPRASARRERSAASHARLKN